MRAFIRKAIRAIIGRDRTEIVLTALWTTATSILIWITDLSGWSMVALVAAGSLAYATGLHNGERRENERLVNEWVEVNDTSQRAIDTFKRAEAAYRDATAEHVKSAAILAGLRAGLAAATKEEKP